MQPKGVLSRQNSYVHCNDKVDEMYRIAKHELRIIAKTFMRQGTFHL